MSDYRELPPPRALATHVQCLWTRTTSARSAELLPRIVPDGCIDLVWIDDEPVSVAGPATLPVVRALQPGATIVGLRFRPGLASSVLGLPASELLNTNVPLRDIWGPRANRLSARATELVTADVRLAALAAVAAERLTEAGPGDDLVGAASSWLGRHPTARIRDLTRLEDLSERQLLRRFEAAVGYGPKTLQRILRFQRWLKTARRRSFEATSLADLAAQAGYADQAHLTREVAEFSGLPPASLLAEFALAGPDVRFVQDRRASRV